MSYDMNGLHKRLRELSKGSLAEFSGSLNPTASEMYGVSVPELRTLAKEIAKGDWESFLAEDAGGCFEVEMLQAFVIGCAKMDIDRRLGYLRDFIPKVHDWAVNDCLCQSFKAARKYPGEVWDFLMGYRDSREEFEVRVVAVMLLSHFLTDGYIDSSLRVLDGLYTGGGDPKVHYYAKMGVAWAIATAMAKYPEKVYGYISSEGCSLDSWTYRKSIQKMRESYRVSDEMKAAVLKLKKLP